MLLFLQRTFLKCVFFIRYKWKNPKIYYIWGGGGFFRILPYFILKGEKIVTFLASVILRKLKSFLQQKIRDISCVHFIFCAVNVLARKLDHRETTGKLKDVYLLHSHIPLVLLLSYSLQSTPWEQSGSKNHKEAV